MITKLISLFHKKATLFFSKIQSFKMFQTGKVLLVNIVLQVFLGVNGGSYQLYPESKLLDHYLNTIFQNAKFFSVSTI